MITPPHDPTLASDHEPGDDRLLDELRQAVTIADPVPERLVNAARGAFVWRNIDEELADLQFDSLADTDEPALVRSSGVAVHLSYATPEMSIDFEITRGGRLVGQVEPPARQVVLVSGTGQRTEVHCDEYGQFDVEAPPSGPARLIAVLPDGEVATDWFVV